MKKAILISLPLIALIGCQPAGKRLQSSKVQDGYFETAQSAPAIMQDVAVEREALNDQQTGSAKTPYKQAGVFLAYRYGYGLSMPAKSVKPTLNKHLNICREAGTKKCQITSSHTARHNKTSVQANLSLRAEPDWLVEFISGMKSDMVEVKGQIDNETISVEDLTRSILDTDARLKAQKALRTRLEKLIETRDAKLPDLLSLERELARVQGEIESATANLKALRARVSMSVVNISYASEYVAVSRASVSPIGAALKDFFNVLSGGIAGVIYFFAYILPWLIFLVLPAGFLLRWLWRRKKVKKST